DTLCAFSGLHRPAEHVLPHRSLDPESWVFLLRSPVRASQIQLGGTPAACSIHHLSSVALHTDGLSQGLASQADDRREFGCRGGNREAALESYNYGLRNFLDVTAAQKTLAQARSTDVLARTQILSALADLAFRVADSVQPGARSNRP